MNLITRFYVRKPVRTLLLYLLMALAITVSCVAAAAWSASYGLLREVETGYTTLAISLPLDLDFFLEKWRIGGLKQENGDFYWRDGTVTYGKETIAKTALESPDALKAEHSGLLSAALLNAKGLSSGTADPSYYDRYYDFSTYNFSTLAVRCLSIVDDTQEGEIIDISDETTKGIRIIHGEKRYTAWFEVLADISAMDCYALTGQKLALTRDRLYSFSPVPCEPDGSWPFEEGKQYLVRAFFRGYTMELQRETGEDGVIRQVRKPFPPEYRAEARDYMALDFCEGMYLHDVFATKLENPNLNLAEYPVPGMVETYYYAPPEGSLPFYAEYTGDWRDYLETEEGRVWKEQIIPWTEMNQNSAAVVLTDNLDSSYNFNTGIADILEGRRFTNQEYESGSSVCLVSAAFAEYNNLSVGDSLELDYYDTGVVQNDMRISLGNGCATSDYYYARRTLQPENRIDVQKTYEIVGIYTAPEFEPGQYNFTADTIFVPKNSVPNAEAYEEPDVAYLNALILKNGSEEAFEAYLASKGMGGNYVYENMQYHRTIPALKAVADNALRLLAVGLAAFAAAAAVVFSLTTRWLTPSVLAARRLGIAKQTLRRQQIGTNAVFFALAAAAGAAAGGLLYQTLTGLILKTDVEFHLLPLILSAAAELMVLLAVSCVITLKTTNRSLMQTRK